MNIEAIIRESNWADGPLYRRGKRQYNACSDADREAWDALMAKGRITADDVIAFVKAVEPEARLRELPGMESKVASHRAPPGGPEISRRLETLVSLASAGGDPYDIHCVYEALHPFTACNGHSGRALLAWQLARVPGIDKPDSLLLWWYCETLSRQREGLG